MFYYAYIRYKELRKLITLHWWKRYLYQKQLVLSWCKSGSLLASGDLCHLITVKRCYEFWLVPRSIYVFLSHGENRKEIIVFFFCLMGCRFSCIHFSVSGHQWGVDENMTLQVTHSQISNRQTSSGQIKSKDVSLTMRDLFKSTNTILHLLTFNCSFSPLTRTWAVIQLV